MNKKCVSFIVMVCIVIAGFILPMTPVSSIQDIFVAVKPRRIAVKATYLIELRLEKALEVHDWIKIVWPKEAKLPVLPDDPIEKTNELKRIIESIYIGASPCSACQGLPEINYRENSIKFNIHMELNPSIPGYEKVNITVTDRVGVINPVNPGNYKLRISTAKEIETFSSQPFEIVESKLGDPDGIPLVTPKPAGYFQNAAYEVRFKVGRGGQMSFNQSRIKIKFPAETFFAYPVDKIPLYAISVNGKPNNNKFALSDKTITIISPVDVDNSEEVTVLLEKEVGIINPTEPGKYEIEVSTSEDPLWTKSEPYAIDKQGTTLRIHPNKTYQRADIQFMATSTSEINDSNPIIVDFPKEFSIPSKIDPQHIFINEKPSAIVSIKNHSLVIYPKESIKALLPIAIHILKEAGIRNPVKIGTYKLFYKASKDNDYFTTDEIEILTATFEIESLQVDPPNAASKAQYKLTLFIESLDGISKGTSLWVQFPAGTVFPSAIDPKNVLLYGIPPDKIMIHPENRIEFVLGYSVKSEENLELIIDKETGIVNPSEYEKKLPFQCWVSKFPDERKETNFQFIPPLPRTSIIFTEGVTGNNNWFIHPPVLRLSSDQKNVKIYLYWDDEKEKTFLYSQPEKLMPGQYISKLSFFAVGAYGTEETQSVTIQVDTIKPFFSLQHPLENDSNKTNKTSIRWKGETKQEYTAMFDEPSYYYLSTIQMNNEPFPISETGMFEFPSNVKPGENRFLFVLEDLAGNQYKEEKVILAKFTPPSLSISSPAENSIVTNSDVMIKGKTDPYTSIVCNHVSLNVSSDGYFIFNYLVPSFGKQTLTFDLLDLYGNANQFSFTFWFGVRITLTMNQKKVLVNDKEQIVSFPPFLVSGRTYLPFRFLGEQLGAKVDYSINPKTKKVSTISYSLNNKSITLFLDKKTIQVNDQVYPLNPPPIIKNGTTFVPVRMVSEYMDCKVTWNSKTQQVIIEYPVWEPSS